MDLRPASFRLLTGLFQVRVLVGELSSSAITSAFSAMAILALVVMLGETNETED
jgi:hypothetical protein